MKKRLFCLIMAFALLLGQVPYASALTDLNVFAKSSFDKGYDVYSGPGFHYYRANNGAARYSSGGVRVYGVCGDWVLIGYGLSGGAYRIGYISRDCLNHMKYVEGAINYSLTFDGVNAYPDDNCYITDDPVLYGKTICKLPKGKAIVALGEMGGYTYVEAKTDYGYMRGFVRSFTLSYDGTKPTATPYVPAPTYPPYTPPTATPYTPPTYPPYTPPTYPPYTPPTYPPYTPPTATPFVPPTYPPYIPPTATPASSLPNTFYHDTNKGEWLPSYQQVTFSSSWPVYSGPGEYYYRAANGKALMGGGRCVVYGVENGWALIGYGLSNGNYRIGYIDAAALPQQGLRIAYLDLSYTTRRLTYAANLTDDIVRYRPTVATLPAGTYVLFLGYAYDSNTTWAYVEVLAQNSIMRGFIPATAL